MLHPAVFYFLVVIVTDLPFTAIAVIVLQISESVNLAEVFILGVNLVKAPILGGMMYLMFRGGQTHELGLKVAGAVVGTFSGTVTGLFLGTFLGSSALGILVGFVLGRYVIGPRLSLGIGRQIERIFQVN